MNIFSLATEQQTSFWDDVAAYFNDALRFENIGSSSGLVSIPLLIVGLFIGAIIAVIVSLYQRLTLGDFVRTLVREKANSPENALDLDYLGYIYKGSIRMAVRNSTALRRVVKCREEEEQNAKNAALMLEYEQKKSAGETPEKPKLVEYRPDPYLDHFYIPEELRYTAEIKFEKKGASVVGTVISIIILVALMIGLLLAMPQILKLVDNFVGMLKG